MSGARKCPKCNHDMEEGKCLVHRTWPPEGFQVQYVKENNTRINIVPLRCRNCGYIELYATEESALVELL